MWITETKKCFNVNVPGFRLYYNPSKLGNHRGGIIMLIKDKICDFIKSIDMETEGQIWIVLNFLVSYKLGGVYIPPDGSPYYQASDMGALASHTRDTGNVLVMGDLNARVAAPYLSNADGVPYVYSGVVDNTLNARGRSLINMCDNNDMIIANHLQYGGNHLGGNLSFKRGDQWISELDLCLAKQECLSQITELEIRQDIVGSDHAPLCVTMKLPTATCTSIEELKLRSSMLGQTYQNISSETHKLDKSLAYKNIDL